MSDEATFLRAIQADPSDRTAKLVYADWLDERGEHAKAEHVRATTDGRAAQAAVPAAWHEVYHGSQPVWDEVTMLALGRLQGLFQALEMCSGHSANIGYSFVARLVVRSAGLQELADRHYGPDCHPVRLDPLDDWKADLATVLRHWLLMELQHARSSNGTQLALEVGWGRDAVARAALAAITDVIAPTAGYRARITEKRWYAIDWNDLVLEAADRVLFLHFSFSD